ncbi:MAG TPA: MOSC domain-containing protein [Candidatus Baltobacteraceae bacterium]|nr:MOSC domain-containing protein [Candidatus Baltobacteraceae bacterium]
MIDSASVYAVRVGLPKERHSTGARKTWLTSFEKPPVDGPVWIGATDLAGNDVADHNVHGGPERAVLFYARSNYSYWERELGTPATEGFRKGFGENLTVQGLDETTVCVGDRFAVGEAVVEIAQPRSPCWKIGEYWGVKDLSKRVYLTGKTGWFARVIKEGNVRAGDALALLERPNPRITIQVLNDVVMEVETRKTDVNDHAEMVTLFARCETLSPGWRRQFAQFDFSHLGIA